MNLIEEMLAEFREKWNYGSFTWNGDNGTGVQAAKSTRAAITRWIRAALQKVAEEGERRGYERGVQEESSKCYEHAQDAYKRGLAGFPFAEEARTPAPKENV